MSSHHGGSYGFLHRKFARNLCFCLLCLRYEVNNAFWAGLRPDLNQTSRDLGRFGGQNLWVLAAKGYGLWVTSGKRVQLFNHLTAPQTICFFVGCLVALCDFGDALWVFRALRSLQRSKVAKHFPEHLHVSDPLFKGLQKSWKQYEHRDLSQFIQNPSCYNTTNHL